MKWKLKGEYQKAFDRFVSESSNSTRIQMFLSGEITVIALFIWRETPEGIDFWRSRHKKYLQGADIREEVLRIICREYVPEDCTWV